MKAINEEEKNEFKKVDEKLDKIKQKTDFVSRIKTKKKIYMQISDVDPEDAAWFKQFGDKYSDGKQFYAIKQIRFVMDRLDPFLTNVLQQLNHLNARVDMLEGMLNQPPVDPNAPKKLFIPKTQGNKPGVNNG